MARQGIQKQQAYDPSLRDGVRFAHPPATLRIFSLPGAPPPGPPALSQSLLLNNLCKNIFKHSKINLKKIH